MAYWDSLKAHNGCLSLWDIKDVSDQFETLSVSGHNKGKGGTPRMFQLRKVPVGCGGAPQPQQPFKPKGKRVLLPALNCEKALEPQDLDQPAAGGVLFLVEEEGPSAAASKVRVMRDWRTKWDLLAAFPGVDPKVVEEVWGRTRSFCGASTILTSALNSHHDHVVGGAAPDMGDKSLWPALEGASSEAGWEMVSPPDGEEWIILEMEEGLVIADDNNEEKKGIGNQGNDMEVEEQNGSLQTDHVHHVDSNFGASYKDKLLFRLEELGGPGGIWLSPNPPPPSTVVLTTLKNHQKNAKLEVMEADDDFDLDEEYYATKAVGARARRYAHRNRLTDSAKARQTLKRSMAIAVAQS